MLTRRAWKIGSVLIWLDYLEVLSQGVIDLLVKFRLKVSDWLLAPLPSLSVKANKLKHASLFYSEIFVIDRNDGVSLFGCAIGEACDNRFTATTPQIEVVPTDLVLRCLIKHRGRILHSRPDHSYVIDMNIEIASIGDFKRSGEWLV